MNICKLFVELNTSVLSDVINKFDYCHVRNVSLNIRVMEKIGVIKNGGFYWHFGFFASLCTIKILT